jgi:hypothetical protein
VKTVTSFYSAQFSETVLVNPGFNELGIFNDFVFVKTFGNVCLNFDVNELVNGCNVLYS